MGDRQIPCLKLRTQQQKPRIPAPEASAACSRRELRQGEAGALHGVKWAGPREKPRPVFNRPPSKRLDLMHRNICEPVISFLDTMTNGLSSTSSRHLTSLTSYYAQGQQLFRGRIVVGQPTNGCPSSHGPTILRETATCHPSTA